MANETNPYSIAVIGGGFSGVAVCFHIAKEIKSDRQVQLTIFEPNEILGQGIAYATKHTSHILNVIADNMSIDPDDSQNLTHWLKQNNYPYLGTDFIPREIYSYYLKDTLDKELKSKPQINFKHAKDKVIKIKFNELNCYDLVTAGGKEIKFNQVILAMGNTLSSAADTPFIAPWHQDSYKDASLLNSVCIIGTGLSAVDVILALEDYGFKGSYTLVSRRGKLPESHRRVEGQENEVNEIVDQIFKCKDLRKSITIFKQAIENGIEWRAIIDALRPLSYSLWQNLSEKQQNQFLRLVRPYWDSLRHRIPNKSYKAVQKLKEYARLKIIRGGYAGFNETSEGIYLRLRGNKSDIGPFSRIYDCKGLWSNINKVNDPLIKNIIKDNIAIPDRHKLGIKTEPNGKVLNTNLNSLQGLYTLGTLRRGQLWESVAVRELRQQAKDIASSVLSNHYSVG